jgi:hypothetical protein
MEMLSPPLVAAYMVATVPEALKNALRAANIRE